MAKYMVLYNSDLSASELMASATPDEIKASMDEWMKWKESLPPTVTFEFGMPLQLTTQVTPSGEGSSSSHVSGYSTMEGAKEEVLAVLKTHPNLQRAGASIDLLEMLSMPGM